jgi:hypothetical protein
MDKITIGFTGTQIGMNEYQFSIISRLINDLINRYNIIEIHHGDCIGADKDFDTICKQINLKIVIHPPIVEYKRAFCNRDGYKNRNILPPKDYLVRNQDIVNACDVLIATPKEDDEQLRSGTWATIRRAKKAGKKLVIVYPDKVEFIKER